MKEILVSIPSAFGTMRSDIFSTEIMTKMKLAYLKQEETKSMKSIWFQWKAQFF